jgi:hypothetical protein
MPLTFFISSEYLPGSKNTPEQIDLIPHSGSSNHSFPRRNLTLPDMRL